MRDENETLKFTLLGKTEVGKTSFSKKIAFNTQVSKTYVPTIGVEFFTKIFHYNNKDICLHFCGVAGDERNRTITSTYMRGSKIIFLFYDVTGKLTLEESLGDEIDIINRFSAQGCIKILVGNKSGEKDSVELITKEVAEEFANKNGFHAACRISVKDNRNIDQPIKLALQHYYKNSFNKLDRLKIFNAATERLKAYKVSPHKFFGLVERNSTRSETVLTIEGLIKECKDKTRADEEIIKELMRLRHSTLQNHQENSFAGYYGLTSSRLAAIIQQTINDFANHGLCDFEDLRTYQKNYLEKSDSTSFNRN